MKMDQDRWWLSEQNGITTPLADRIEQKIIKMLDRQPIWQRSTMIREIYHQFNRQTAPELTFVNACLDAYTQPLSEKNVDQITIRDEDDPQRREREILQLKQSLKSLADRLDYQAKLTGSGDVIWIQEGRIRYLFRCLATAIVTPHLSDPPEADGGQRCLVLPGGRAALIHLKLKRDPRLLQWLDLHQWQFIKFRHLRRMVQQVKSQAEIEVFMGLDPIVEQGQAQIPLPLKTREYSRSESATDRFLID
jgi:hypothetical protein